MSKDKTFALEHPYITWSIIGTVTAGLTGIIKCLFINGTEVHRTTIVQTEEKPKDDSEEAN